MAKGYPKALEEYDLDDLLTVRQLADDVFHIHTNTLYRWVQQHQIPHIRIGNRIFFRKKAIQDWMRANEEGVLKTIDLAGGQGSAGA